MGTNKINYQTSPEVLNRIENKAEEEEQKSLLQNASMTELKAICKKHGIKGYSGKNKSTLSELIVATMKTNELEALLKRLQESLKNIKHDWYLKSLKENLERVIQADKALQSELEDLSVWYQKCFALERLGEIEEALRCYDQMLLLDPEVIKFDKAKIINSKADLLVGEERLEDATFWYKKALDTEYSFSGDIIMKLEKVLEDRGHYEAALSFIKKALNDDRTGVVYLEFTEEHSWEEIDKLYETLIGLQMNHEDEDELLISYTNWEDYYKKCLNCAHPPALLGKAKILINKKQFEEAQEALDETIRFVEQNGYKLEEYNYRREAWFHKARIAALLGDKDKVMDFLGKTLSIIKEIKTWVEERHGARTYVYSIEELFEDIRLSPEFNGLFDPSYQEFQFILHPEKKKSHFCQAKNVDWEDLAEVQKEMITYLCKNVGPNIYLDFELIQIGSDPLKQIVSKDRVMALVTNDNILMHIEYDFEESLQELKMSEEFIDHKNTYKIKGNIYKKEYVDNALKILGATDDKILVSVKPDHPLKLQELLIDSVLKFHHQIKGRNLRSLLGSLPGHSKKERFAFFIAPSLEG